MFNIMELYHYTIHLDPRTKKNSLKIAGVGVRCPVCKKPARQFIRQSTANDKYSFLATKFLVPRPDKPLSGPVHVKYHFYMQTRRRVDEGNLAAEVDDLLVKCNILSDDNYKVLVHHDGTRVFYDKEHPRTEIWIYDYKEEEDEHKPTDFQDR